MCHGINVSREMTKRAVGFLTTGREWIMVTATLTDGKYKWATTLVFHIEKSFQHKSADHILHSQRKLRVTSLSSNTVQRAFDKKLHSSDAFPRNSSMGTGQERCVGITSKNPAQSRSTKTGFCPSTTRRQGVCSTETTCPCHNSHRDRDVPLTGPAARCGGL